MPQAAEITSGISLKIGGSDAPHNLYDSIISVEVDDSVLLPSMVAIRLHNPGFEWTDNPPMELGKTLEVGFRGSDQTAVETVFNGEITAIEPEFNRQEELPSVTIRGFDKSHRLHRGKKIKTFNNVSDSDLASRVAQGCGLSAVVDSTRNTYEWVLQDNQTDMEFLQGRARLNGYHVYVEKDKLYFVAKPKVNDKVTLEWGLNLLEFQARLTVAEQVTDVEVCSWDRIKKEAIKGNASTPDDQPHGGISGSGGAASKKAFGGPVKQIIVNCPVENAGGASALAKSFCDELGNAYVQADGSCAGNPKMHAGITLELKGIGTRFSGNYKVSRVVHRYDRNNPYITDFEISGRRANTLGQLLSAKDGNSKTASRGVVVGIVTNLDDPENLARVKVKYPNLFDTSSNVEVESFWARLVTPMAGASRGIEFIPEVNDEVLVAFEYDDIHRPYILGSLWNKTDQPPETTSNVVKSGKVEKRIIRSRSGHQIILDDTSGKELISIIDKSGNNKMLIDTANKSINVNTDQKIELKTKGGRTVTMDDSGTKIEVVCGGNSIKMDASNIEIKGAAKIVLDAPQVEIKGVQTSIKPSGQVQIEAPMSTIKGSATLILEGGLVKIN